MARVFKPVFPRWPASGSPATTPTAEFSPPKVRWQRFSPRERCWDSLCRGLSPAHTTLLPCSSAEIGPHGAPPTHGDDIQTAL